MKTQWPRPDFLRSVNRPSWLAWLWLATAALVLGFVVRDGLALQTQVQQQTQAATATTSATATEGPTRARRNATTAAATGALRNSPSGSTAALNNDAAVKAQAVAQQLSHPWARILFSLEAETPPGLQWLLFDHNASGPELRFEGMAPTSDVVLDMVSRLSAHRGWSDVVLSRLQAGVESPDPLWRFEIKAQLDPRAASASFERSMDNR